MRSARARLTPASPEHRLRRLSCPAESSWPQVAALPLCLLPGAESDQGAAPGSWRQVSWAPPPDWPRPPPQPGGPLTTCPAISRRTATVRAGWCPGWRGTACTRLAPESHSPTMRSNPVVREAPRSHLPPGWRQGPCEARGEQRSPPPRAPKAAAERCVSWCHLKVLLPEDTAPSVLSSFTATALVVTSTAAGLASHLLPRTWTRHIDALHARLPCPALHGTRTPATPGLSKRTGCHCGSLSPSRPLPR